MQPNVILTEGKNLNAETANIYRDRSEMLHPVQHDNETQ
jgi:hypothetical protein